MSLVKIGHYLNPFLLRLAFSNFFLVSSYSFLALHTLFIHKNSSDELQNAVYLGFGIFNSLQVGGVWLLEKVFGRVAFSRSFFFSTRLVACVLLFINSPYGIVLSYLLFGLSSASFFKLSRQVLKNWQDNSENKISNPYIVFSISTNLSFVLMPYLGSKILTFDSFVLWGIALNVLMSSLSVYQFPKIEYLSEVAKKSLEEFRNHLVISDFFRLLFTLLPYAVMITLPPLKAKEAGLSSEYSSYLYIVNGLLVVVIQVFLSRTTLFKFSFRKYDFACFIATICFIASYFLSYQWFVVAFTIWSIVETYQIPSLEYLLFGERSYDDRLINRLLMVDAAVCLIGPLMNSYLIH